MLKAYAGEEGRLQPSPVSERRFRAAAWIDLLDPTPEEAAEIEAALGVAIPTREDMEEIEISSRLYQEDGAAFMTALLLSETEGDNPMIAPVCFILTPTHLITVRHTTPRPFETFPTRAERAPLGCDSAEGVLLALLEAVIDRLADIEERVAREVDALSHGVFQASEPGRGTRDYQPVLKAIGRKGDLVSKVRESLVTLERLLGYLQLQIRTEKDGRQRLKTMLRDTHSLVEQSDFLADKFVFLLDATLGLINIQQNGIIKIFSVAAVVFLPPTLIASIYGMNFEFMPELALWYGYPLALGSMVVSAVVPLLYFKRRGWL